MELNAPSRWRCIDFISDLHLQADDQLTFQAWRDYLLHTTADAVFILGDLFEVWVGDDILSTNSGFESQCAQVLRDAALRTDIHIMQGNRDFLMGPALMQACTVTFMDDPSVLQFGQQRWVLTHGDAFCLEDTDYIQFRAKVRSPSWQRDFLSQPLDSRVAQAKVMRKQSEARKRTDTVYADVDTAAANTCLDALCAHHMIHGHTHQPAQHALNAERNRWVLSDWDLCARAPRAEILRLRLRDTDHGLATVERITPEMACVIEARPED